MLNLNKTKDNTPSLFRVSAPRVLALKLLCEVSLG